GLFLSPDGGASWQKVLDAAHIWHMAFDPGNSRVVYAGDYDRVYKSADGGSTWQAGPSGTIANGCQALVAVAPGRLFVSSSAGIRFSGDAGMTWADRMEGIRARPVCGIAVAPSSPQIVYFGGWPGDFYRSADFGETVTRLPFPPNYVSKIQVNPADADDLFVGASGLLRSRDGGQTWTSLLSRCADFALGRSNVHHIFASGIETFDNGDRSRVTFFKSLDGGSSWESRPIIDDAQGPVGASAVTVDAAGEGTLYLGANYEEGWHDREGPGGGLVFKSADGGATWTEVVRWPGNNIYDITADPKTPGLLFLAAAQGIYKSQDGGATWRKTGQMNGGYVVDFEFNPVDSREVWFGTYDDVYFSPDRGETWSRTYGWDYWSLVRQIDFSPDGALLYAGTGNTGAFRMRRSGAVLSAQVSGTVASAAGVPIPGALIALTNSPNTATTDDAGRYSVRVPAGWSGTLTPSANGWTFNPPNRQSGPLFADVAGQDFAGVPAPTIGLSRKRLNFGAVVGGPSTPAQSLRVFNAGAGTLDWWVGVFAPWLSVAPKAGTNAQTVFISVDPTGLAAGSYVGTLGFAAAGSSNSPQEVEVRLTVLGDSSDRPPYGHLDTPVDGSPAAGSVAVTGWALDDVEVRRVEVKRDPAAGDAGSAIGPDGLVFVGNAVFVPGARADVAAAYPDAPQNGRAGWGYLLLTNMLPNGGNGTFVIHAVAFDSAGQATRLGRTTLHCDNANAVAPFGAIDTPTQGGIASGPAFANFGWALTPWPKEIPRDGSTIWVFVDGVPLGHPAYNLFRRDIFDLFPGYANRDGPVGHFVLDTTKYADGLHSIAWGVADGAGEKSGIGSRFFTIQNGGSGAGEGKVLSLRPDLRSAMALELASPGDIEVEEMEPVESAIRAPAGMTVVGWGETLGQDLPVGSTLDPVTGLFSWIPGPGFLGRHVFHFAATDGTRVGPATEVVVRVVPRDYGRRLAESREKSRRIKKER
ncbi:MAG: hypothetical protein FJY80_09470, partial [Candidatus Aminicenantes bacterium]|nr:hypothetical protein [Candidatus Aminicenantes bacterium]